MSILIYICLPMSLILYSVILLKAMLSLLIETQPLNVAFKILAYITKLHKVIQSNISQTKAQTVC